MTSDDDGRHFAESVVAAKAAVAEAKERLRLAQRTYLRSLEADDRISQVAFLLYQQAVQREPDWEGPVTWEDWHDLQIEEERDDWRELAAQILALIDGPECDHEFIDHPYICSKCSRDTYVRPAHIDGSISE